MILIFIIVFVVIIISAVLMCRFMKKNKEAAQARGRDRGSRRTADDGYYSEGKSSGHGSASYVREYRVPRAKARGSSSGLNASSPRRKLHG